jgi:hypothetical protein
MRDLEFARLHTAGAREVTNSSTAASAMSASPTRQPITSGQPATRRRPSSSLRDRILVVAIDQGGEEGRPSLQP